MRIGLVRTASKHSVRRSVGLLPASNGKFEPGTAVSSRRQPFVAEQRRWNYQVQIRRQLDRKTGRVKYQNWDYLALSIQEPRLANGQTLLNRHLRSTEHIKPTERKRRINAKKAYDRDTKRVEDLSNYIKFMQEHDTKN